jgi:hypothetical protein
MGFSAIFLGTVLYSTAMRYTVLAIIAAVVFSANAYMFLKPSTQTAAAGASPAIQGQILYDTSRIIELLRSLLSLRSAATPPTPFTIPLLATSAPRTAVVATTTSSKKDVAKPVSATTTTPAQDPTQKTLGLVLPSLRSALVNIICIPTKPGTLRGISGSGVMVSPRGIVLTVAHVAQYELLAEARPDLITCTVRTGSPAVAAYKAAPVYVSSAWISQHADTISSSEPRGTGENDFALLAITATNSGTALPSSFPYVSISNTAPEIKDPVVIGSYGAEFLTSARIQYDLFPTLVFGAIQDRFTFDTNTVDLISLGGGAAAQQGSSGGGVLTTSGLLTGLITTSSNSTSLQSRDLHAITTPYLQRAFRAESGTDLNAYVTNSDTNGLVTSYASQAKKLADVLVTANSLGN